jgi:hypothetical protein
MALLIRATLAFLTALAGSSAQSQGVADSAADPHTRLLKASRFVENYKEMAAVSARVFGARGKGSDKELAHFMSVVSTADLSDVTGCLVALYRAQLTREEVATVVTILESPLGEKVIEQSQRMLLADIERGSHQPLGADAFTHEEKRELLEIRQNASFRKYMTMTADRAFGAGTMQCIGQSEAVKKAGIRF